MIMTNQKNNRMLKPEATCITIAPQYGMIRIRAELNDIDDGPLHFENFQINPLNDEEAIIKLSAGLEELTIIVKNELLAGVDHTQFKPTALKNSSYAIDTLLIQKEGI